MDEIGSSSSEGQGKGQGGSEGKDFFFMAVPYLFKNGTMALPWGMILME